jgi:8-oxo-dGTP pyrophosphatase MutT (NUDIX family)
MEPIAEKVTAFVTRVAPTAVPGQSVELLLFEHPSAGIQFPAGTVEADEPHAVAAAREAAEETGLLDLPPGRFLTAVSERLPDDQYMVATTTRVYARPDTTSFDWASIRNGILVHRHRTEGDFAHITFVERDERADPPYVSYQITGWMPSAVLTRKVTRYFYHFAYHGQTPQSWFVDTDNHRFRLFWAPFADLPPIVAPQRWWVDILVRTM